LSYDSAPVKWPVTVYNSDSDSITLVGALIIIIIIL